MDIPKDDPSRYLLGLVGGGGSIRVRRADMVSVAAAREAHAQAVIRAWTASHGVVPADLPVTASWRAKVRRRLRSAAHRLR